MFRRTFKVLSLASLVLVTPSCAQFGLNRNKKKPSTSFESLNEMAKKEHQAREGGGGGADMADMAKLQEMFGADPSNLAAMGQDLTKAMEELSKLSPEELQQQMEDALNMMTQGDMVESIIDKKEEVLRNLEETGMVSAEELEKFKNDPAYFESQMRDAFDQMKGLFSDPDVLKTAAETMKGMQDAFNDPSVAELTKLLEAGLEDDTKIEEARLQLLSDPGLAGNPVIKSMFEGAEFQEILQDPKKWRDSVREGQEMFKGLGAGGAGARAGAADAAGARAGAGAGVGEL